jgi:hypothetical protein
MDKFVFALGPAFAAGFAVQQLLEILDPLLDPLSNKIINEIKSTQLIDKKIVLGVISLIFGFILTIGAGLRVLRPFLTVRANVLDIIVTALIISGGTEGLNSIIKFLGYAKENKKIERAERKKADIK